MSDYLVVTGPPPDSWTLYLHPSLPVRYFRVDTGRTWLDCDTREIDHIYECQKFVEHDKFMLYALKGRTFFTAGERDRQTLTTFYEGIGG